MDQGEDRGTSRAQAAEPQKRGAWGRTRVTSRGSRDARRRGRARTGRDAGGAAGQRRGGGCGAGSAREGAPPGAGRQGAAGFGRAPTQGGRRKAGKSRAESGRAAGSPPAYLEVTGLP